MPKKKIPPSAPVAAPPQPKVSVKKPGRPKGTTLLQADSALAQRIADNVAKPMPFKYACTREGISEVTGYDWLKRGEAGESGYVAFFEAVTRAKADAVAKLTDHALGGGRGSMNAVWFLERRYREDYGNIQRIEHAGHDGGAVEIKAIAAMTDEELRKLAEGK